MLANINRNVLIDHLPSYKLALRDCGLILLSGFFIDDTDIILEAAQKNELTLKSRRDKNKWQLLCLGK